MEPPHIGDEFSCVLHEVAFSLVCDHRPRRMLRPTTKSEPMRETTTTHLGQEWTSRLSLSASKQARERERERERKKARTTSGSARGPERRHVGKYNATLVGQDTCDGDLAFFRSSSHDLCSLGYAGV